MMPFVMGYSHTHTPPTHTHTHTRVLSNTHMHAPSYTHNIITPGRIESLPVYLHPYWHMCVYVEMNMHESDMTQPRQRTHASDPTQQHLHTCYLTIDEREVREGDTHRRGGIHIESPGIAHAEQLPQHQHIQHG